MKEKKETQQMVIVLPKELHTTFKTKCVSKGIKMKDVVEEMIYMYVHNKNN